MFWGHIENATFNFPESFLEFTIRVRKDDGTEIAADKVRACNLLAHTLWKKIELFANGVKLHSNLQDYGIKTVIDTMLDFRENAQNNSAMVGWWARSSTSFEHDVSKTNDDFKNKCSDYKDWTTFMMCPNLDVFKSSVNLISIPQVVWELRLTPQEPKYVLNALMDFTDADTIKTSLAQQYLIELKPNSTIWHLRYDRLTTDAYSAQLSEAHSHKHPYKIWYRPTVVRSFPIPRDQSFFRIDDLFPNQKPLSIWITFMSQTAYGGSLSRNPFFFWPGNTFESLINRFNGELIRLQRPIKVNMADSESLKKLYWNNLKCLEIDVNTDGLIWSHKHLKEGWFLYGGQLHPCSESANLVPNIPSGAYGVDVDFVPETAKAEDLVLIVYGEFVPHEVDFWANGEVVNTFTQ